jgi:hypothetical protein
MHVGKNVAVVRSRPAGFESIALTLTSPVNRLRIIGIRRHRADLMLPPMEDSLSIC